MSKIDTTKLRQLLEEYNNKIDNMSTFIDNNIHNPDNIVNYINENETIKLSIGVEYCKITADRNSSDCAKLITPTMAQSLLDSIESGNYK